MTPWEKLGMLFDVSKILDKPEWFHDYAQAPNAVDMGDFVRFYFSTRGPLEESGNYTSRVTYVDYESLEPPIMKDIGMEPILDLGQAGCFDEHGTYPISVLKHQDKFIGMYGGWSRCESVPFDVAIGLATSLDGKKFTKLGSGPVLAANEFEPFVVGSPKLRYFKDKFYLTYIAGREWTVEKGRAEIYYKLRIAHSDDCISWKRANKDIIPDKIDLMEAQASGDIFEKDGVYHMWFCFRSHIGFRDDKTKSYRIGYAKSTNLIDWERSDSSYELKTSNKGWDSESVSYPNVFTFKNQIYLAYLGNNIGKYGFGVAKLVGELS